MNASIALSAVLVLALLGAAAALTRRGGGSLPGPGRTARPGADRRALEAVARGLRAVARGHASGGRPLPEVRTVVHSGQRLTLRLAEADRTPPAPWTASGSGMEWTAETASLRRTGGGDRSTHPYSLTVTLGRQGGDRVLVDLARASGPIALTGGDNDVLRLAQVLIKELVSGPVGPLAAVVLVGSAATPSVMDELGGRSPRLHTAENRDKALACAGGTPSEPAVASAFPTLHLQRGGRVATTETHARRLFVVTAAQFRNGRWADIPLRGTDALLVLGYIPDAEWYLKANPDGSLDTGPLGVRVDTHLARMS